MSTSVASSVPTFLTVHATVPNRIVAPAAVVVPGRPVATYHDSMIGSGGSLTVFNFEIVCAVQSMTEEFAQDIASGDKIALRDLEGVVIATLDVGDIWTPDKKAEALGVYGTSDEAHPAVHYLNNIANPVYVGGKLRGVEAPTHYDFKHLRNSPAELREQFRKLGWRKVMAFQTRNPMHRAHQELTLRAAFDIEANLLIHPVVGMTKPGDVDHFTRVRCYEHLLGRYPEQTTMLSLLPLAMRMGGPRETLWHAIIRKNYGCTHFIVGPNHGAPPPPAGGRPFYGPFDAQELVRQHEEKIGVLDPVGLHGPVSAARDRLPIVFDLAKHVPCLVHGLLLLPAHLGVGVGSYQRAERPRVAGVHLERRLALRKETVHVLLLGDVYRLRRVRQEEGVQHQHHRQVYGLGELERLDCGVEHLLVRLAVQLDPARVTLRQAVVLVGPDGPAGGHGAVHVRHDDRQSSACRPVQHLVHQREALRRGAAHRDLDLGVGRR